VLGAVATLVNLSDLNRDAACSSASDASALMTGYGPPFLRPSATFVSPLRCTVAATGNKLGDLLPCRSGTIRVDQRSPVQRKETARSECLLRCNELTL
jgi:hypothetical protein